MKKIAVLASGEGTNAERIIRYFKEKRTAEVALVISSRPSAGVIERARRLGVVCKTVVPSEFRSGEALRLLQEAEIDFVVLAGFLSRIPDEMVHAYEGHMVNIHPSLLPKFGGNGMYGMHVHEAVQYINEKYDEGDYVFQAACPVLPEDTPESLAARVHELEYRYYPEVIERLVKE